MKTKNRAILSTETDEAAADPRVRVRAVKEFILGAETVAVGATFRTSAADAEALGDAVEIVKD